MKSHPSFSLLLVSCLLLIAIAGPAAGQERSFGTRGDVELAGSISFSSVSVVTGGNASDATTILSFGPQVAYFVADGFEIGFSPGIALYPLLPGLSVMSSGGNTTTVLQLFLYPGYNFRTEGSKTTPFLEAPIGYTSVSSGGSDGESGFSWGVRGGVKINVTGQVLLTVYGEYLLITLDPSESGFIYPYAQSGRNGFNYLSFGIGLGGFF